MLDNIWNWVFAYLHPVAYVTKNTTISLTKKNKKIFLGIAYKQFSSQKLS